jgi:hypothetical protein
MLFGDIDPNEADGIVGSSGDRGFRISPIRVPEQVKVMYLSR